MEIPPRKAPRGYYIDQYWSTERIAATYLLFNFVTARLDTGARYLDEFFDQYFTTDDYDDFYHDYRQVCMEDRPPGITSSPGLKPDWDRYLIRVYMACHRFRHGAELTDMTFMAANGYTRWLLEDANDVFNFFASKEGVVEQHAELMRVLKLRLNPNRGNIFWVSTHLLA